MGKQSRSAIQAFLRLEDEALLAQCEVDHYRSRGPGGQKRNKTSSAVRLRHRPTGLIVTATEDRSQHVNKTRAVQRLREAIALGVRTRIDVERYTPSTLLCSCVTAGRALRVGRRNVRYHAVVCELLDLLASCGTRVREAAGLIDLSTAALVGFMQRDRKLWKTVNEMRAAAGVKPLR